MLSRLHIFQGSGFSGSRALLWIQAPGPGFGSSPIETPEKGVKYI